MIILKYKKMYPSSLSGHVDTLRTINHILRRAKCNVEYSKGFNPHMELMFSPALSLGVESLCEYVLVDSKDFDSIISINKYAPLGIQFTKWWIVDELVNLPNIIDRATYSVHCPTIGSVLNKLDITKSFVMTVPSKKGQAEKDIAERIFGVKVVDNDNVQLDLACGNTNLKCDLLVNKIRQDYAIDDDYTIVKINSFVGNIDTDSYIDNLADCKGEY